eukprot:scaffold116098_cov31-Prasinocladus_malaysianus.AAC.1
MQGFSGMRLPHQPDLPRIYGYAMNYVVILRGAWHEVSVHEDVMYELSSRRHFFRSKDGPCLQHSCTRVRLQLMGQVLHHIKTHKSHEVECKLAIFQ